MIYLDCETCGLHGVAVILQYAVDSGPVFVHEFWNTPVQDSMHLIESICEHTVVGFNLSFDWFHLQKLYNMFELIGDKTKPPIIEEMSNVEINARDGSCVKPKDAIDVFLYYRKTDFQKCMERKDVCIRRIPTSIAPKLAAHLNKHIILDDILFAGYSKHTPRFKIFEIEDKPDFVDIKLKFKARMGLKVLANQLLNAETINFGEISAGMYPLEYGYAPFAACVKSKKAKGKNSGQAWPQVIQHHIDHWKYNSLAREYATNDVIYTRALQQLSKAPVCTDSILACCVASCRWKGYAIDLEYIDTLIEKYETERRAAPTSPKAVRIFLDLTPIEAAIVKESTDANALKALHKIGNKQAKLVLNARKAMKKLDVLKKLKLAGRFHASFKVIGALSNRMSGADGLNAQGIDATKEFRLAFPLAFSGEKLMGGDMQSFEISIADAVYQDPELRKQLMTCDNCGVVGVGKCVCGSLEKKSFHGMFGMAFFDMTYEAIMASKGMTPDFYKPSKIAGFATLYGAQPAKLVDSLGVTSQKAKEGFNSFWKRFSVAGAQRQLVINQFTSLKSVSVYEESSDYIQSLLGFKRFFTLENKIIKALWTIAQNTPKDWDVGRVFRGDREQTAGGAVRSALFGAAFNMQNAKIRQAANHQIQSTGAGINKAVQVDIWALQPHGAHSWHVRPLNVHDELQVPCKPELAQAITDTVYKSVEAFRAIVPLIGIDFGELKSWADKS